MFSACCLLRLPGVRMAEPGALGVRLPPGGGAACAAESWRRRLTISSDMRVSSVASGAAARSWWRVLLESYAHPDRAYYGVPWLRSYTGAVEAAATAAERPLLVRLAAL